MDDPMPARMTRKQVAELMAEWAKDEPDSLVQVTSSMERETLRRDVCLGEDDSVIEYYPSPITMTTITVTYF